MFVLVSLSSLLNSVIWEVKQDGTGNFTTIQEGIIASSNTDTVLVYPGTYFENLLIEEKCITIGSLYLTTGNESYISQTIIDGFENDSVIRIEFVEAGEALIIGFIIQNGFGYMMVSNSPDTSRGGGFLISESIVKIRSCFIQNNRANSGGGLFVRENSSLTLIGNTIRHNRSLKSGGGIAYGYNSNTTYSAEILNNIYLNYAGVGSDIAISHWCPFQEIIIDTFTVIDPAEGYYFIYPSSGGAGFPQPNLFSIDIQNAKIEQVNYDLYVSTNGDDNNSGLTSDDPLQSIAFSLAKIRSDSLHHKTIYVEDGNYSTSQNNQYFPLHLKSYVNLEGESRENTILDAELYGGHIYAYDPQTHYTVENFKLINSRHQNNISIGQNAESVIKNIHILNDDLEFIAYYALVIHFSDISVESIIANDIYGSPGIYLYSTKSDPVFNIVNCEFGDNTSNTTNIAIGISRDVLNSDSLIVNIINTKITDNVDASSEWLPATVAIHIDTETKLNLINCTIGNNETLNTGAAIQLVDQSAANIVNSIIYGNTQAGICLNGTYGPCTLNTMNSLIDGGTWDIMHIGTNIVNWDDDTMLDENPLWVNSGNYPYALSISSPCINTGTLDLPSGIVLPEFDLAGNPRIYGETIDMGAYEFQEDPQSNDENEIVISEITQISNYPNPFNPSTTIKLDLAESGQIELAIYNIKGQKVKTLMDAYSVKGQFEIIWRGVDENKRKVASGQYFIKLYVNGKEKAVSKCVLLK